MKKKQRVSFRIAEEEVGIKVSLPAEGDVRRAQLDFHGTDKVGAVTYLEEVAKKMRDEMHGVEDGPDEDKEGRIIDMKRWQVRGAPEGEPRIMAVDKYSEDVALFAKEWKYMDEDQSQVSAMPRPPQIKHQHDEHCMRNFEDAMGNPSLKPFINQWQDKCVILVGSGQSLRRNKQHIPADDPRFVVIAVNETCAFLEPEQIDYCFLADRAVGEHPEWFPKEVTETTPLICNTITSPEVVDQFNEVHFWRSNNLQNADDEKILKHIQHLDPLDVGQHVTFSAFHLAYKSGAPYILFAGQDFAASTDWYSATRRMTPEYAKDFEFYITRGMKDEVVLTCPRFMRNMRLLKGQAAFVGDDNRIVVNGTGRGMFDLESHPNDNAEHFTPENNVNLDMPHAIEDAKNYISNGNKLENSQEIASWDTNTTRSTTQK